MADQDHKQQSQPGPAAGAEAGSRNQKEDGTSEVDARQGVADQSTKDKVAQGINLHKDQYPETLEDASLQSEGDKLGEYGTSEVNARQGATDQSTKDKIARGINLHKDQYPQIQENPSSGSAQTRSQTGETGTSEKSV